MRNETIQVSTTVDSEKAAKTIALNLLGKRLAACVQVWGPITSHYWWRGRKAHTMEWFCIIKARARDYRAIETTIKKVHPYKIPEIVAIPFSHISSEYLNWIKRETTRTTSR